MRPGRRDRRPPRWRFAGIQTPAPRVWPAPCGLIDGGRRVLPGTLHRTMRIALSADHAGFDLKQELLAKLSQPIEQVRPQSGWLQVPEDAPMRIVEREFDRTAAPIAARAIRAREEATRPRSQKEKLGTLAGNLSETLKRLLKR